MLSSLLKGIKHSKHSSVGCTIADLSVLIVATIFGRFGPYFELSRLRSFRGTHGSKCSIVRLSCFGQASFIQVVASVAYIIKPS